MMMNKNYKSTLHTQLRDIIRSKIEDGEYVPGTAIPSENQLAETYGLTRLAVRNALAALEYEGLLKSVQGKGVFVLGMNKRENNLERFGGYHAKEREDDSHFSTRTLIKAIRKAGPFYAQLLNINAKDDIWFIRSVECLDDEPMCLEETYIPFKVLPNLEDFDLDLFSLVEAFKWEGVNPYRGEQMLRINHLDASQAKLIGITPEHAIMERTALTRDANGRIISFKRNYVRNDKATFFVEYAKD